MPLEKKSCNTSSSNNNNTSTTSMRKDPASSTPSSSTSSSSTTTTARTTAPLSPVSPPTCHRGVNKLVKFCPHDLQRLVDGQESSSACLLQLQESDSVSTAESTSCSSSSSPGSSQQANSSSSNSSSSGSSTNSRSKSSSPRSGGNLKISSHYHHGLTTATTTTATSGLLRHRTGRDFFALPHLMNNDTTSLVDTAGVLVDTAQHDKHHHTTDHHSIGPAIDLHQQQQHQHFCFSNGHKRRRDFNHVFCSTKNLVMTAAQKQLAATGLRGTIMSTLLLLVGMTMMVVLSRPFDSSPYYWYYLSPPVFSTISTLPRLPLLLASTTTTTDSNVDNPLAISALATQKLLQKINHASLASSTTTANNNNKKKKKQHHQHFTLRLQGSRVDLLHMSLDQHAKCPGVAHVQIDWTGPSPFLRAASEIALEDESIRLQDEQEQEQSKNSLSFVPFTLLHHASHKVGPIDPATTHAAVLLLNERVSLSCRDLARAFQEWRKAPTRVVGFFPLLQPPPPSSSLKESSSSSSLFNIRARNNQDNKENAENRRHYSLLSDRALFIHKLYLPEAMRHVLRQESSHVCREYMLAARIVALSNQTPVAMTLPNHHHLHQDNIDFGSSRLLEEDSDRLECLPLLLEAVGKTSLPTTDAVYIGHDVRLPSSSSSSGGDKTNY